MVIGGLGCVWVVGRVDFENRYPRETLRVLIRLLQLCHADVGVSCSKVQHYDVL